MSRMRNLAPIALFSFVGWGLAWGSGPDRQGSPQVEALAPFRNFVGEWRGAGQPQRGSTRGAWTERGQWEWKFGPAEAFLQFDSPQAKFVRRAELRPAPEAGAFELTVLPASEMQASSDAPATPIRYQGRANDEGRFVFTTAEPPTELPARITLGLVAQGDRLIMLLERKAPAGERFSRLAEVGYTRAGSQFGKGTTQPECVVTGGHASIAVEHEGKTYYVCCGGCRDLFNEDPAQVLADYRERKAAEKQNAKP